MNAAHPYRAACPVCAAREDAAKMMLPFVKEDRQCPECQAFRPIMWARVCKGENSFLVEKGFWFFGWRRRVAFSCKIENAPNHFHFACERCKHRWMMLTATEGKN